MNAKQRATRVLYSQGKAPVMLSKMTDEEIVEVAAMCDEEGKLVENVAEKFSAWLIARGNCEEIAVEG